MTTPLQTVLSILEDEVPEPPPKVALVSDRGSRDESSLIATRQGYLALARALVKLAIATEPPTREEHIPSITIEREASHVLWSGVVAECFYSLPSFRETNVVGAYVCEHHDAVLSQLQKHLGVDFELIKNDPSFAHPSPDAKSSG